MGRNKIGLQAKGLEELMASLDELSGTSGMQKAVEGALKASKQHVTPKITQAVSDANLPAKGRYATGAVKDSIDTDMSVEWEGLTASIHVGFNFKESGLTSIFLMYGTPKMPPVKGLKAAIYGAKTQKEIADIQADEINKVIKRTMEG